MSNEPEQTSESQPNTSTSSPNLVSLMGDKLGIARMLGSDFADSSVLIGLLLVLKEANILSDEQINFILDRTSQKAAKVVQELRDKVKGDADLRDVENFATAASTSLESLREILNAPSGEPPQGDASQTES